MITGGVKFVNLENLTNSRYHLGQKLVPRSKSKVLGTPYLAIISLTKRRATTLASALGMGKALQQ